MEHIVNVIALARHDDRDLPSLGKVNIYNNTVPESLAGDKQQVSFK
jgi:hypothetical protein